MATKKMGAPMMAAGRVFVGSLGAYAGSQFTNVVQKNVPMMDRNPFVAPLATMVVATGTAMYTSKFPYIQTAAMGAAIFAGAEILSRLTNWAITAVNRNGNNDSTQDGPKIREFSDRKRAA